MAYSCKLLEPGWAGLLSLDEAKHIKCCLEKDAKLRRKWKIRGKKPSLPAIAAKAYPEDPDGGRRYIQKVLTAERYRIKHKT